jgi:general secretion pathway protein K
MPSSRYLRKPRNVTGRTSATRSSGQRGFALLVVIWVLALLAVLATGFSVATRSEVRQANNLLGNARARTMADSGVALAIVGFLDQNPGTQWATDGAKRIVPFEGGTITVSIQDEAGKVNLNAAPAEMIDGLLTILGFDSDVRTPFIEAILARRKEFAATTLNGLERGFSDDNDRLSPASVSFRTLNELRTLTGITRKTYDRIVPFVTVFSQTARINPLTAPREVLLALPGVKSGEVDAVLTARTALAEGRTSVSMPLLTGVERYAGRTALKAVSITSIARTESRAVFARRAVALLNGSPDRPYEILDWRQLFDDID